MKLRFLTEHRQSSSGSSTSKKTGDSLHQIAGGIMGMDFSALVKWKWSEKSLQIVESLEHARPAEVRRACDLWERSGFADLGPHTSKWVANYTQEEIGRPGLPSLEASLSTPEGFFLMFGADAVWIYHVLRWRTFLTNSEWQSTMLRACRAFCKVLGATEGIITSDWSTVIQDFFAGLSYEDALAWAKEEGREVAHLRELYIESEDDSLMFEGYWRFY
jgi:hypothetical protein